MVVMFKFIEKFDTIQDDELILKISQKYCGDEKMLPFYYYDIYKGSDLVGKVSIRIGCNFHSYFNGNIGYEVFKEYRGNGYAFKACKLILKVAQAHGMTELYVTCDKSNIPSYKTIEKLGAQLVETCYAPKEYFGYCDDMEEQRIYNLILR